MTSGKVGNWEMVTCVHVDPKCEGDGELAFQNDTF